MKKLGKLPIVLRGYIDNFIVNRIQRVIMVQTWEMLQKGWATAEQIDYAVKTVLGVRLPVQGIIQSQDFTGLDLILEKQKEFRTNKRYPQVQELVEKGNLGVKTGKGFYDYGDRTELEILRKRDELCLKMNDYLEKLELFKPL
jgi:3-hydroxyacyl-CoA dehydrogenase